MPRAKARPERPRVRSGSACGVFRLSVRRVCPAGTTARPCLFGNGPAADLAGSSGWVRRWGGCRSGGAAVGGRLPGRVCFGAARPAHSKKRLAVWPALVGKGFGCRFRVALGSVCGARSRVWRSVPCLALGPVFGARSRVWRLSGAAGASGGVRPGACVRLPGRSYCSSSVIETLTCSLTKSPASSDAASRGTNSSSVKPIRYSRALYEPFWGPSMSVKFSVRLSF